MADLVGRQLRLTVSFPTVRGRFRSPDGIGIQWEQFIPGARNLTII
jgi:hypothetical protein